MSVGTVHQVSGDHPWEAEGLAPSWSPAGAISRRWPKGTAELALILFGILLFAWEFEERGLWSAHEGRAAQNAQSILDTGEWIVPRLFTDDLELQKPPLYYWMVALIAKLNGGRVTALAVRLPAVIAALAGLVFAYRWAKRMWGQEAGWWAALILATMTRYAWLARVGRIDMPLCLTSMVGLFLFWRDRVERDRPLTMWFYAWLVIGIYFKGPVAAVLVLLPIASYLVATGKPIVPVVQSGAGETWRASNWAKGTLLVVALVSPWFVYAIHVSGGEYYWEFLIHHNLERALGTDEGLKAGPIWFYLPRLFVDSFPWSILFVVGLDAVRRQRARLRDSNDEWSRTLLFVLCWIGSQFVFLSLVSFKRADYLLPLLPAVALFLAGYLTDRQHRFEHRLSTRPVGNTRRQARTILIMATLLASIAGPLFLWGAIEFRKKGLVKSLLKIDVLGNYLNLTDRFMMSHVERLIRANWPLLLIAGVVLVGSLWLIHTGWHTRQHGRLVIGIALPWLTAFLFQTHLFLPALDPLREMSRFGEEIRTAATNKRTIHYFVKFDADLVFHAGRPAKLLNTWDELARLTNAPEPAFVVMKASTYDESRKDPRFDRLVAIRDNRQTAFGEHRDARVLVTNNPRAATIGSLPSRPSIR